MPLVYTIDHQWNTQCLLQLVFLNLQRILVNNKKGPCKTIASPAGPFSFSGIRYRESGSNGIRQVPLPPDTFILPFLLFLECR